MFGMFKEKVLDRDKAVENIVDAVLTVLSDDNSLNFSKFSSTHPFNGKIEEDPKAENRFHLKKLELITSVAHTLLQREDASDLMKPISERIKTLLKDLLHVNLPISTADLASRAEAISKVRFSTNPKDAGEMIENNFSESVFNLIPSKSDIDARYLLYKQLSSLERASIFAIGDALRNAKS